MTDPFAGLPPAAQLALARVAADHRLRIQTITRRGPRFFVAQVVFRGRPTIWKICVQPASQDVWSARKFSREIRFLQFLSSSAHPRVRTMAPRLYASSLGIRPWYLREFIHGRSFEVNGNIRFRPQFFTPGNLAAILQGLKDLQSVRPTELPAGLRSTLRRYDTIGQSLAFLRPFWGDLNHILGQARAGADLRVWLRSRSRVFNSAPVALAHHEPYAPHFIRYQGRLRLIDWENINWANPVADAVVLWMRAAGHPAWQAQLKSGWKKHWPKLQNFDQVWETDLVVRSIFTLLSARTYADQADIRPLARVAERIVRQTLKRVSAV